MVDCSLLSAIAVAFYWSDKNLNPSAYLLSFSFDLPFLSASYTIDLLFDFLSECLPFS